MIDHVARVVLVMLVRLNIVLWSDGDDIAGKPLMDRRRVLERIIKPTAGVQLGTCVEGEGKGMEGIIAKAQRQHLPPGEEDL